MAQQAVAHASPGGEAHFTVLQMEPRLGEAIEIARVIVMQMGDDHVANAVGADAEIFERIGGIDHQCAGALARGDRIESGIDQNIAVTATDQPDEIIEVRSLVVNIRCQIVLMRLAAGVGCIADRIDFAVMSQGVSRRLLFVVPHSAHRQPPRQALKGNGRVTPAPSTRSSKDRWQW